MTDKMMREALEMCRQAALAVTTDPATRFDAIVQFADAALSTKQEAGECLSGRDAPSDEHSRRAAWLIERQPAGSMPAYLAVSGTRESHNVPKIGGEMYWSNRADDALQFAQRPDAIAFVSVMLGISNALPLGLTTPGLRVCDPTPTVHEHMWVPSL